MMIGINLNKCPECGSKMTYIPENETFDGLVPGYYQCYNCGHREEE